eukprot:CAMPEP_0168391140 /NCGR_PEP_ID=MMETSP0228-20121227/17833_1 /TAXON_ID=133427 /ORGANISM="Protoceratium reticulatum, Strain CCCM 535 (=CCMP 1889)" /LENGTH=38 /DNA_ID= /DNA_START= /DNA_END= /DNA_ORIENTATION=
MELVNAVLNFHAIDSSSVRAPPAVSLVLAPFSDVDMIM